MDVSDMKFWKCLFFAVAVLVCAVSMSFADIKLPEPKMTGGPGIFELFNIRESAQGGSFPSRKLELAELSELLWAASGLSRDGKGWTVPMAKGKPPYCKIYVALEEGTFLYDWENHNLVEISKKDIRASSVVQDFAKIAPCTLFFVSDAAILSSLGFDEEAQKFCAATATGSMSQNILLASSALHLGARYIMSIDPENITKELNLTNGDKPLSAVLLGKYAQ